MDVDAGSDVTFHQATLFDQVLQGSIPMRVQIVSNLFSPDELAGASLYTDLAQYLASKGHDVRVTTTFSYYPAWKLAAEDQGIKVRDDVVDGIPVRRIAMHVPAKPTGKGRLLSDVSFLWSLVRHGPDIATGDLRLFSRHYRCCHSALLNA